MEQGKHLVATFHPELTPDSQVHALFLRKVKGRNELNRDGFPPSLNW